MAFTVRIVDAALTYGLRHEVLRPHLSLEEVANQDSPATTFAAFSGDSDELVSIGSLLREEAPDVTPAPPERRRRAWRLRYMATRPEERGKGAGATVLAAAVDHVADAGGGLLWCQAREAAVAFYERAGFKTAGERFAIAEIGWHVVMWRDVERRGD